MEFRPAVQSFTVLMLIVFSHSLSGAEVYRWTDENGKVHFSDKANKRPRDKNSQEKIQAEEIEVKPTNSADKPDPYFRQSAERQKDRESEQNQARQERQQRRSEHRKKCAKMRAFVDRIGTKGGTTSYLVGENGESFSDKEQEAELARMRREMERTGCR